MKKILLGSVVCFLIISGSSLAQTSDFEPPLRVQTWFYERYENAPDVTWEMKEAEGNTYYEASFKFKGKLVTALLDDKGAIKEEVSVNRKPVLTTGIKIYIDQNYSKFKLVGLKCVKVFDKKGNFRAYYELMGKEKQSPVSFWFNENNEIIQKDDLRSYASL